MLEMDCTVVQVTEQYGAADGDDDCLRQPLGQKKIERVDIAFLQSRDRLVAQQDVGLRQQCARKATRCCSPPASTAGQS